MYRIKIENCNNIADGELDIEDGKEPNYLKNKKK